MKTSALLSVVAAIGIYVAMWTTVGECRVSAVHVVTVYSVCYLVHSCVIEMPSRSCPHGQKRDHNGNCRSPFS